MLKYVLAGVVAMMIAVAAAADKPAALNFTMKRLDGKDADLSQYQGKVVMVVNVASKCGLTPQYKQLQALYEKYEKQGFVVLGFPCNQFLHQEPGTAGEIRKFCTVNYGVTFPLFAKIEVNGEGACPLYKYLTALDAKPAGKGKISWNFEKFVIGRNGEVIARFSPAHQTGCRGSREGHRGRVGEDQWSRPVIVSPGRQGWKR